MFEATLTPKELVACTVAGICASELLFVCIKFPVAGVASVTFTLLLFGYMGILHIADLFS